MRRTCGILVVVPAMLLGAGCASESGQRAAPPEAAAPAVEPRAVDPRAVTVLDGQTGAAVDWNALVSAAAGAETVVIGEMHGHPVGLPFAAALWEDVLAGTDSAALSLEFFERDEQSRVDDYLAGLTDEETFRRKMGRTDASYPAGHRAMVEAAKKAGRPVHASNSPRSYVRAAGRDGYDRLESLTPEQRRMFRIPDSLPTGRYREEYNKVMDKPHGAPGTTPKEETPEEKALRLENGFRAQSLWDWTMAESIADALDSRNAPVVQVVGRFHSDFRGGLIEALENMRPGTRIVTISTIDQTSGVLRDEDRGRADFVVYVGPQEDEGK